MYCTVQYYSSFKKSNDVFAFVFFTDLLLFKHTLHIYYKKRPWHSRTLYKISRGFIPLDYVEMKANSCVHFFLAFFLVRPEEELGASAMGSTSMLGTSTQTVEAARLSLVGPPELVAGAINRLAAAAPPPLPPLALSPMLSMAPADGPPASPPPPPLLPPAATSIHGYDPSSRRGWR